MRNVLNKLRNEKKNNSHPVLPFAWRPIGYVRTHVHPVVRNPSTGHIFGQEYQGELYWSKGIRNGK